MAVAEPPTAGGDADGLWIRRSRSPTGLAIDDLAPLGSVELATLADWHKAKAGDNDGRPWWGRAIRNLPIGDRVMLALDPELDAAWCEAERRRCIRDVIYFVGAYGHVQPEEGDPLPFDKWAEQDEVLQALLDHMRVIILKARQLGLTWLCLHFAFWLQALAQHTPNAKILALSKHGGDATKLIGRARKINALLPPYLKRDEEPDTRRSLTRFKLVGRGEMISLAGTPEAARMETATFALLDEFAHIRNRMAEATWTAVQPTLGKRGKAAVIFTGNGPAEAPGDGQAAARLWNKAREGAADKDTGGRRLHPVFLPTTVDPGRDNDFYAAAREDFISEDDYRAEYPLTEDDALAGRQGDKVYSPASITAAVALGRELDTLLDAGQLPPPAGGYITGGVDWGEYTHALPAWPLEGGGFYWPPGEVCPVSAEVSDVARAFMLSIARLQILVEDDDVDIGDTDDPVMVAEPLLYGIRFDGAGVQSMRTFVKILAEESWPDTPPAGWPVDRDYTPWAGLRFRAQCHHRVLTRRRRGQTVEETIIDAKPIPFNKYKDDAKDYARHLLGRTLRGHRTRVMAFSPRNPVFVRQMRGLELKDDGSGKIEKGDDHGPDAMLAGLAPTAKANRDRLEQRRKESGRG
jgi:hypothetical protein